MNKPAIVIPVFKRVESLKKLLWSIERAFAISNVSLVFRFHKGAATQVIDLIENYLWKFGDKRIINDPEVIDLDENLRRCGDLSKEYGSIIILEDDSIVSPFFYIYARKALDFYENDESLAQVSLYRYRHNAVTGMPFQILDDDFSTFFVQKTSTRGQAFTAGQWQRFREWLKTKTLSQANLPNYIRRFGENNWEFQHNQYLIEQNLFGAWPKLSLSSNQGFSGTHHPNNIDAGYFQSPLQSNVTSYEFAPFYKGLQYDAYGELSPFAFTKLAQIFDVALSKLCIDLNGTKPFSTKSEFWLTSKPCQNPLVTFSDELKPIELNILWQFNGNSISLCHKNDLVKSVKTNHYKKARKYFSETTDVGLWDFLRYKWLKYVERKKLKK